MPALPVWQILLCVGLGGAVGSNVRYFLGYWINRQPWSEGFPWATGLINISGSVILGLVAGLIPSRSGPLYLLLGVGFCGGYTTFSTFSLELVDQMQRGRWDLVAVYLLSSLLGGMIGLLLVYSLMRTPPA